MNNKEKFKYLIFEELKKELKKDDKYINNLKIYYLNKLLVLYCKNKYEFAETLNKLEIKLQIKNIIIRKTTDLVIKNRKI